MITKIILALLISFLISLTMGYFVVMFLRKKHVSQSVSRFLNERHLQKDHTPTMGGVIFIFSSILIIILLWFLGKINFSYNLCLILFAFISYALLGFLDDFLKIKYHNNNGLSINAKFIYQVVISIIFYAFLLLNGGNTFLDVINFTIDLKYFYGIFILFLLVGSSNAVNITDGLDGLAAGCAVISFITLGIIAFNRNYIVGNIEIGIFCFILSGSLLGFLFYNFYPAKVFMGDLGSLSLGAAIAAVAICLKCEMFLILIGIVYIIETLSSLFQIIFIKMFSKKLFLKSPLHHHYEEKGLKETEIIKLFYMLGVIFSLITLIFCNT